MALEHAQPAQAVSVQPYGSALAEATTRALFKSDQLEVVRIVLRKGKTMPSHHVPGEITIQCIEGVLDVQSPSPLPTTSSAVAAAAATP